MEQLARQLRRIVAPSEKRTRTLIQELDAEKLDQVIGGWLRAQADAGRLEPLLTAIAIDGKWLRGVGDGQVKLFAAMLHEEKMIIAQHRIPDETTETTQSPAPSRPSDATGPASSATSRYETGIWPCLRHARLSCPISGTQISAFPSQSRT